MKKLLSVTLAVTTIAWLAGSFIYVPTAKAAVIDGDIVSADATFVDADGNTYYSYDVFIVKIVGSKTFKRLVLNPQVFTSYGHLKWSNLKKVAAATVKGYTTSSLTREINDTKVYKLIPDGDTGTKQWVEDLACFTSKGYDWDSVYIINATDRDNYTTGSSLCGVVGDITLSMASDTPGAATVPKNAYGTTFMKINISGSGTISQMTFSRKGAGDVEDFDNLYIYENNVRLTTGRSISSANSKATFINLSIKAPTTIELVADLSATAGNQDYFSIESASSVTSNATVGGTFPLNGNPLSMSGTDAGTLAVEKSGSTAYNVDIGTLQAEISAFKITASTEGALFKRIQLFNSGTATNTLVTNLKLKDQDGNIVATASKIGDDGYVTFVLTTPFSLAKGTSKIFRVYADPGAQKPERTIGLYLELATDILATGTTFGYGMKATITSFDSDTADHIVVTLKGGDLNLAKSGPGAKNIGTDTDDTVFLEFTMSAVADITIKKTRITFCHDAGGDGAYADLTVALGGGGDLEDVKMKDKDTGAIYAGPKDGSAIDTEVIAICPGDQDGVYEDFDDTFDISAGETKTMQITADITTANTDLAGQTALAANDKIEFVLYNWPQWIGASGNISYMRYAGTTDAVDDSAISPSSNIAGDEMTIQAATLAITLAASPSGTDATERKFALGQDGVDMVGFIFTSAEASDIKVTGLTLTGYVDEGDDDAFEPGIAGTNYVKDTIAGLELWEAESNTKIASTKGWSGTNYQDMIWSGISWTIPAGGSKTLLVKGNISSSGKATGDETDDTEELFIDIPDASVDITANDKDGNSVTATGDAVNGGETAGGCLAACNPGVDVSVIEKGHIAFDKSSDTPESKLIAMGTTSNEVSKYKITGSNEAFLIEKFSVDLLDDAAASTAFSDDFSLLKLKYQTQAQWGSSDWTISTGQTFANEATLSFAFSGTARPYIPKNDDSYVSVLVDVVGYNGGEGADSTDWFKIALTDDTDDYDEFKALGAQSNKYVSASEPTQTDFYTHWIVRSYPFVEKVTWSGDQLELARFSVTAMGGDVVFGYDANDAYNSVGDILASAGLEFDVISSGGDNETSTLYLYDWSNNIISSTGAVELDEAASAAENDIAENLFTTISFGFEEMAADLIITSGATKTFYVLLDTGDLGDFDNTDEYIYLKWLNTGGPNSATISAANDSSNFDILYEDKSDDEAESRLVEHRIGIPRNIKNIGSFPISFNTLRGTLAPQ